MTTPEAFNVLLAVLGSGGLGWWFFSWRGDRREKASDERATAESDVNIVVALLDNQGKMQAQIGDLYERWTRAEQTAADARADAASARSEAAAATAQAADATREVRSLHSTLSRVLAHFRPVVDWIDAGALHPPPSIPEDVRDLLRSDATTDTGRRATPGPPRPLAWRDDGDT